MFRSFHAILISNFFQLLVYIFKFLNLPDLKNARLVCHSWYEASQDSKLVDKEVVNFSGNGAASGLHANVIPTLVKSSRDFFHFLFKVCLSLYMQTAKYKLSPALY